VALSGCSVKGLDGKGASYRLWKVNCKMSVIECFTRLASSTDMLLVMQSNSHTDQLRYATRITVEFQHSVIFCGSLHR
jgi:hypothetical protein